MNWIVLAAIRGSAGGALGFLIGTGIQRLLRKPTRAPVYVGVALALVGGRLSVLFDPPPPASVDGELAAAGPGFDAVRQYYPDAFAQMAEAAKTVKPGDPVALQNTLRPMLTALMAEHRKEIDDASARALGTLMLDETKVLQATSPQSCVGLLTGGRTSIDMRTAFPPEFVRRDDEVTAQLLEQVSKRPAAAPPTLTQAAADDLTRVALVALSAADQQTVRRLLSTRTPPGTPDEARALCGFYRGFFQGALDGPPGTLRRLLTS